MLTTLLATIFIAGLCWHFFFRKSKGTSHKHANHEPHPKKKSKEANVGQQDQHSSNEQNREPKSSTQPKEAVSQVKKSKNKVDHPYFHMSFKKNESNITDYDFSLDCTFLVIASKDCQNVLYNIKTSALTKITSSRIPQVVAISEKGKFVAFGIENKIEVFQVTGDKPSLKSSFKIGDTNLMGLFISEIGEYIIAAGSYKHSNFNVVDLKGNKIKMVMSDITDAAFIRFFKHADRAVYYSSSPEIRIFRSLLSVKQEYKDFTKEHALFGHKGSVISGAFSRDNRWYYSISTDGTIKEWDLSPEGFKGHHINCSRTWKFDIFKIDEFTRIEWIGQNENQEVLFCITDGINLYFVVSNGESLKVSEKIEDPHSGDLIEKLEYLYDSKSDKKGILFTKSQKRLFSWKPKFD